MGGHYHRRSRQSREEYKREQERKRVIREERNKAKQAVKAAKDAWIKSQRKKVGENESQKLGWLAWLLRWWRERKAWEQEMTKRARGHNPDHELTGLIAVGSSQPAQDETAQGSGVDDGRTTSAGEQLKKRKGGTSHQV